MIRDRLLLAALDGAVTLAVVGAVAGGAYVALHAEARANARERLSAALAGATWQWDWMRSPAAAFARRQRSAMLASEGLG